LIGKVFYRMKLERWLFSNKWSRFFYNRAK